MQTNAIRRTSQRATTVRDWMVEKANYLNTWYNEKSDFYSVQGNFSCNDLLAQEKFLSLPSLKNDESSSRIEHRSLLSIRRRAFFMPSLYRIGGCRSVNLLGPVRVKSSFFSSGMCSRFSVSPRPAAPGMLKNDEIMQTNAIGRSAVRAADIRRLLTGKAQSIIMWYNGRSGFYSELCGFDVTRKLAVRINLLAVFMMVAAIVGLQQPVAAITAAVCSAWMVCGLNREEEKGGDDENC